MKIMFGPQGVGKGTVGAMISKKYHLPLLGTGQILRAAIEEGTELGNIAKDYINDGNLVPDKVISDVIREKVKRKDGTPGYILDGFPRTLKQAELFGEEMDSIDYLIGMEAPEELLIHRLTGRRISKSTEKIYNIHPDCEPQPPKGLLLGDLYQRDDDKPEAIRKRLDTYYRETAPILDKYADRIHKVDARPKPEVVMAAIEQIIQTTYQPQL